MDSLQNSTIPGYLIDGVLGEGGMGAVYRATQLSLNRLVALKVLTPEFSSDSAFRERFRREGLLQATLDHPHIVPVYEAGETDDHRLFLAMRMIEGPTLKELIVAREMGERRALRLLTQVAEALDSAHAAGLIHRDIKPQNVLVGKEDHAYLADFGLTQANDETRMTATGLFVGTIDYIAPEQARGELATEDSDTYALTAVLYECLSGKVPFVRPSEEKVLLAHLTEDPPRLSDARPDLPAAVDEVIAQGMAKDPSERPGSARELMIAARRALGVLPAAGTGNAAPTRLAAVPTAVRGAPGAPGGGAAAPRGSRGFLVGVAVAALAAAIAGALLGGARGSSASSFSNSASVGVIELSYPSSWRRIPVPAALPGLALSQALALGTRSGGAAETVRAGLVSTSSPGLLAPSLAAGAHRPRTAVKLGAAQAYRYTDVTVPGLVPMLTIFAVPTTAGVVTIACPQLGQIGSECEQIAGTLRLNSAQLFPITPSRAYADGVSRALRTLQREVAAGDGDLAHARTAAAQAGAADRLAGAYSAAGTAVGQAAASPAIRSMNERLARALAAAASGYADLARAARAEDGSGYARAVSSVRAAVAGVSAALVSLGGAGYSLG